LSRAGDDAAGRAFIAPDQAGLLAGESAMMQSSVEGVLQPDPASVTSGAYPLTLLTYAAVTPGPLDQAARNDYAAFVEYAAGPGQEPGLQFGKLPQGYAPLPDALRAQARDAAVAIRNGTAAPGNGDGSGSTSALGSGFGSNGSFGSPNGAAGFGSTSPSAAGRTTAAAAGAAKPGAPTRASSTTSTPDDHVGFVRYLLPAIVIVGLAANLGALALNEPKKKLAGVGPDSRGGSP
jgi:hypothetical protein